MLNLLLHHHSCNIPVLIGKHASPDPQKKTRLRVFQWVLLYFASKEAAQLFHDPSLLGHHTAFKSLDHIYIVHFVSYVQYVQAKIEFK